LLGSFLDILVQICQFHQIKIIVRHLTKKPKSPAARALRVLLLTLTETTQAAFEAALKRWHEQYAAFLNERQRARENTPPPLHAYAPARCIQQPETASAMVVYLRAFSQPGHPEYDQFAGRQIQRNEAAFAVSSGPEKGE